jgi:hypothetical protein
MVFKSIHFFILNSHINKKQIVMIFVLFERSRNVNFMGGILFQVL